VDAADPDAFDPEEAARALAEALRPLGTPERADQEKRYLKSDLEFFGVTVPDMRRTVKAAARSYPGYAEPMLAEKEFFIRKAIGWVLREVARRNPRWVAEWTEHHISTMSGITFRETVRRLPADETDRLRSLRLPGNGSVTRCGDYSRHEGLDMGAVAPVSGVRP
jgi:3-methyladenine DNA glycosylase AlkD